jgi:DNA-directed RNA polymerase specialized sigma subunit
MSYKNWAFEKVTWGIHTSRHALKLGKPRDMENHWKQIAPILEQLGLQNAMNPDLASVHDALKMRIYADLQANLGREPSSQELEAAGLLSLKQIQNAFLAHEFFAKRISLDAPVGMDDEGKDKFLEVSKDNIGQGTNGELTKAEFRKDLEDCFQCCLSLEEKMVFQGVIIEEKTEAEVAQQLNKGQSAINKIKRTALLKLRNCFATKGWKAEMLL